MLQVSFLDKLSILKNLMTSSVISLIVFMIIIFVGFLFLTTNKNNAKESKTTYIIIYIICLTALVIQYATPFATVIDYFMSNVFVQIYFPNLAVYVLALIISNIIMWRSIFKSNDKIFNIINTTAFCIIHYLFVMLLYIISTKKLDVFTITSVYGNKEALALIELTSSVFILWIILMIIYKVVHKIQTKEKKLILEDVLDEDKLYVEKPYIEVNYPKYVLKELPKKYIEDDQLTVDDYKKVLDILNQENNKSVVEDVIEESQVCELKQLYMI